MEVQFIASPSSSSAGQSAVCRVRVQVTDLQPPTVTGCPNSKTVFLEPGELARLVQRGQVLPEGSAAFSGQVGDLDGAPVHRQCED